MRQLAIRTPLMLTLAALLALAVLPALRPAARAADAPPPKTLTGEFVKWQDQDLIVLVEVNGAKKEMTLKVSDQLAITLNGKAAKRTDLKEQMPVVVTPAEGVVTQIDAKALAATTQKSGRGDDDDDDEHEGGGRRNRGARHDD